MLLKLIVCIIAGLGAGVGTGLAGLSAAAVISPMLITFLGFPAYEAVGISLASDVLASAVSAYTYGKHKNLDIKNGLVMLLAVLVFTLVGSWAASRMPNTAMGGFSVLMTLLLGIKFIVRPVMTTKETQEHKTLRQKVVQSILCAVLLARHGQPAKLAPLAMAWVLSLAAPVSWMVLSKAHAAIHTHLVPMLWHFALVPVSCLALVVMTKEIVSLLFRRRPDLVASH